MKIQGLKIHQFKSDEIPLNPLYYPVDREPLGYVANKLKNIDCKKNTRKYKPGSRQWQLSKNNKY